MRAHELVYQMFFFLFFVSCIDKSFIQYDDIYFLFVNNFLRVIENPLKCRYQQPFKHPTINIYAIDIKSCKNIKVYANNNETSILERGNVPYKYRFEGHSSDYKFEVLRHCMTCVCL